MIITASKLVELFMAVKADKHQSEDKAIVIFAANGDVDSVCSTAQLESILGKADVPYSIIPVESYAAVSQYCQTMQLDEGEELRTVFMINCGATEDVRKSCHIDETVRVIVMDSHRPVWHGYNNNDDQNCIVVVDEDDPVPPQDVPAWNERIEQAQGESSEDDPSDDLSSDEDDSESSDADNEQGEDTEHATSSQGQQGPGEAGTRSDARKRRREERQAEQQRRKQAKTERREDMLAYRRVLEEYYDSKAGYGKPTALLFFDLALAQQEDNNFVLWLAILGITDQYVHQRMDPVQYSKWRGVMDEHVHRLNNVNMLWGGDEQAADGGLYNNPATHQLTLSTVADLKIPLLRYWSLYEALQYTHHIATRMQTWREVGQAQLNLFLADLAIPLKQSQAQFMSMHPEVMRVMETKLESSATKFRIAYDALKYKGFEMRYKNDIRILATDYVHALTAVLGQSRADGKTAHDIFRDAIDCLFPNRVAGYDALRRGLEAAKQLAQAVVQEGGLVITRGQIQGGKTAGVWVCDLSDLTLQNATLLQHPYALLRLAFFLRDARAQRLNVSQPLVVVGPMNGSGMCYVVAIRQKHMAGVMQNNPFSEPFKELMRDLGAGEGASLHTFDNAVFLLKRAMVPAFVEELRAKVQAMRSGLE